jgi:hypothetical protein
VFLSGLDIEGVGSGTTGINFIAGKALHVKNTTIRGFATGISFAPGTGSASLVVQDSVIADNSGGGILIKPVTSFSALATLTNVHSDRNLYGVRAEDNSKVNIFRSTFASNQNNGVLSFSAAIATEVNITDSMVSNNGINGIVTSGALATIHVANIGIFDNGTGVNTALGGTITGTSPGTNANSGNTTPGAPNGPALTLQ